ncbi:MAG: PorP/SprF family type IX secretion system membrane protein [Flavobacteriales bacterium]|nr:PorP/SprF family type IX secretion system membrane protein [Flavobacteriales bacterium]
MKVRLLILVLVGFSFAKKARSQDPQISQFIFAPVYLNPALAGETRQWRFTINSRIQWPSTKAKYVSNALTAEYNVEANHSGLAAQILHDESGSGKLTYVSAGGVYSYKAYLGRKLKLNFGIKGSFNQRYFDRGALIFASDIAENSSNAAPLDLKENVKYFDVGSGAALVSRRWWVGISLDHLNRPNYAFSSTESRLALKYSLHAMYEFVTARDKKKQIAESIVVGANYKGQLEWDQLDIGGFYNYHNAIFGIFYRGVPVQSTVPNNINQDAMIVIAGYKWLGLRINYSYDITVSKVYKETGGTHEFSLITEYPFRPPKRRRSSRILPCPKW